MTVEERETVLRVDEEVTLGDWAVIMGIAASAAKKAGTSIVKD